MSESLTSLDDQQGAIRYLEAFRRRWPLIVGIVVAAVAAAALISFTASERYEASADVIITPLDSGDETFRGFSLFREGLTSSSVVVQAARLLNSDAVRARAEKELGAAADQVSFDLEPLSQADVVVVKATAPEAALAAQAANAFARSAVSMKSAVFQQELRAAIERLQRRAAAVPPSERSGNFEYSTLQQQLGVLKGFLGSSDPTVRVLRPATAPDSPSWPRTGLSIAVALLVALLLGAGLSVGLEFFNPRLMREEELAQGQRLPILARIPRIPGGSADAYLHGDGTLPEPVWGGYRTLRAVLAAAGKDGFPSSILVTSASSGDGKTMTAVNLATILARADLRVVLVDADPYRPMVASIFKAPRIEQDGLIRLLTGRADVREVLVPAVDPPGLQLLLVGPEHVPFMQMIDSERSAALLDRLAEFADVVVIDSPPLPDAAETLAIADAVEAVVIAVRLGHTRRVKLAQLRELLARRNVSPLGLVVTVRDTPREAEAFPYYAHPAKVPARAVDLAPGREQQQSGRWGSAAASASGDEPKRAFGRR